MVKVYKNGVAIKESIAMGEVIKEDETSFKIHTSNIVFSKKEYRYETAT